MHSIVTTFSSCNAVFDVGGYKTAKFSLFLFDYLIHACLQEKQQKENGKKTS